jgi:ferredoxin-NADP reductase
VFQAFAHVVLLAGGTGITPMFQIASAALCNPVSTAHFIILSFSKSDRDICMHQDLLDLQARYPTYLTLKFIVSDMTGALDSVIKGSIRTLPAQQLLQHAAAPVCPSSVFCTCGPSDFTATVIALLGQGGVPRDQVLAW